MRRDSQMRVCRFDMHLPCSSWQSKWTWSCIGLVLRPVTLCRRWARWTARSRPDRGDAALVSNSALDSSSNSAPELGNLSGSGSGLRLNCRVDHFNHDLTWFAFHSAGSVGSSVKCGLFLGCIVTNEGFWMQRNSHKASSLGPYIGFKIGWNLNMAVRGITQ